MVTFLVKFCLRDIMCFVSEVDHVRCAMGHLVRKPFDSGQHRGQRRRWRVLHGLRRHKHVCYGGVISADFVKRWKNHGRPPSLTSWLTGLQPIRTDPTETQPERRKRKQQIRRCRSGSDDSYGRFVRTPTTRTTRQIIRFTLRSDARDKKKIEAALDQSSLPNKASGDDCCC